MANANYRVIQAAPYRHDPQLNLYAGLLIVLNAKEPQSAVAVTTQAIGVDNLNHVHTPRDTKSS